MHGFSSLRKKTSHNLLRRHNDSMPEKRLAKRPLAIPEILAWADYQCSPFGKQARSGKFTERRPSFGIRTASCQHRRFTIQFFQAAFSVARIRTIIATFPAND
jgi:hypothetical protein